MSNEIKRHWPGKQEWAEAIYTGHMYIMAPDAPGIDDFVGIGRAVGDGIVAGLVLPQPFVLAPIITQAVLLLGLILIMLILNI